MGSCFAVAEIGGEVGGQSIYESESPLSVPLGHLSPKGETISYMYALLVFVISEGEGFFRAPALQSLGWWGLLFLPYIVTHTKKSHSFSGNVIKLTYAMDR